MMIHIINNQYIIMATTVKTKFRASSSGTKEGTLFYQVIRKRVPRQINTGYKLYPQEWDAENKTIVFPSGIGDNRRNYLVSLKETLRKDIRRLKSIIAQLERADGNYTADDVVENFFSSTDTHSFIAFAHTLVGQMKQIGKQHTAYETAINSFTRFRKDLDVPLDKVDSDLMIAYEAYLKLKGICPNSISFYMRNLRAIYNRAVDKELTEQRNPFKHVYTGIDKTVKRAVPLKVIRQIRDLDLSLYPMMDYARNIFMFSFYTRGMSLIDMAFLKKKNLQNGVLSYRRHKTNQQLSIKWEKPMQELIDKFDTSGTPYLLPILKSCNNDERKHYKSEAHRINRNLKKIGKLLGLTISLTSYVARHSWASIAQSKNIPISTISEAMGHDSETTTRIYLASLDTSVVDKANSIILKSL